MRLLQQPTKAQASIDYLTTFAWMALALILAVSVLYTFDMFSFSRPQQECFSGQQLVCLGSANDGINTTQIFLSNTLDRKIIIDSIITSEGSRYEFGESLESGESHVFELSELAQGNFDILFSTENNNQHSTRGSLGTGEENALASDAYAGTLQTENNNKHPPASPSY